MSRRGRRLGLTDTNNGLRVFNKTVADGLNITMSGMSHANEFVMLIAENDWRVVEEPVEVLYTDYSKSKGQPLLNGVNIIFDGFLRGRIPDDELDPGAVDRGDHRAAGLPAAVAPQCAVARVGQGRLCLVRAAGVYAVLRPDDTTVVAHWFGVHRGTDLMLYALIMAFSFTTLSTYMRFKDLELRYARLARAIALEGAQAPE